MEEKFCPIIKKECLKDRCEWWSGKGQYTKCAIHQLGDVSFKLYRIQQAVERGGGGGSHGGGDSYDDF